VYAGLLDGAESAGLDVAAGRLLYVHVARGSVEANGVALEAGDALKLSETQRLQLQHGQDAEVLVFDLPSE
jgi:redox-sensitive bicupin YhaK (pirin superfamily)